MDNIISSREKPDFQLINQFINRKNSLSIVKPVYQSIIQFPIDKSVFRLIIQFSGR